MLIFRRKDNQWEHYVGEIGRGSKDFRDIDDNWSKFEEPKVDTDLYYSFDEDKNNFHVCYKEGTREFREFDDNCDRVQEEIKEWLKNKEGEFEKKRASGGATTYTKGHRWYEIIKNGFSYMICFQSL